MKTIGELKTKLYGKSKTESQRTLYTWVRQDVISLKQFKELLEYCI